MILCESIFRPAVAQEELQIGVRIIGLIYKIYFKTPKVLIL